GEQATAQGRRCEIFGKATAASGGVLRGFIDPITSSALLQAQAAVTAASGGYRFPTIPIGTYTVTFDLAGFKKLVHEGIVIQTGFNAEINGRMEIASVQETVTVTGESPVVDTKSAALGTSFGKELLDAIPSARDPWVILATTTASS